MGTPEGSFRKRVKFWEAFKEDAYKRKDIYGQADGRHKLVACRKLGVLVLANALAYILLLIICGATNKPFPSGDVIASGELLVMSIAVAFPVILALYEMPSSEETRKPLWAIAFSLIISAIIGILFALAKAKKIANPIFLDCATWLCIFAAVYLCYVTEVVKAALDDPVAPPQDPEEGI